MQIQLPVEYEFLNFDRFDVHVKGKALTEAQLEQVKADIASTTNQSLKALLSRQLGIYYGFHLRSSKLSSEYCKIWQSTIEDQTSEEYAEACNYIGFAESINGGYRDPHLFETALAIYQALEKTAPEDKQQKIKLDQAFAWRYIGVTTRRQGIQLKIKSEVLEESGKNLADKGDVVGAEECFKNAKDYFMQAEETFGKAFGIFSEVIHIQQNYQAQSIDLAESYHLLGVAFQSRKKLVEAKASLQQALSAWKEVVLTTGPHPINWVSMQTLGNILTHLGDKSDAIELLQRTHLEQITYFGTENQEDIAKTMHFLGEAYEANGEPLKALTAYKKSSDIKQVLGLSEITEPTRIAIEKLHKNLPAAITEMNTLFQYDWNNAQSIESSRATLVKAQHFTIHAKNIFDTCTEATHYQLAQLLYKVATFYLHAAYNEVPDRLDQALSYLELAKPVLKGQEYNWVLNQMACAYQQKITATKLNDEKVFLHAKLVECNTEVIERLSAETDDQARSLVAFTYCTAAQGAAALGNVADGVKHYREALDRYELLGMQTTDQYLRAKNVYASYLDRIGAVDEAKKTYSELEFAWQSRTDCLNSLYAGRFYALYAKFLVKICEFKEGLKQLKTAFSILSAVGNSSYASEISTEITTLQDARIVSEYFRLQPLIEILLEEAKKLLETKSEDTLNSAELINLALTYMESGNRADTKKYASLALAAENASTTPSNENKATILYVLATFKREDNLCDEALTDFHDALALAESDWLKSNLLRNIGLAHLKLQQFHQAAEFFQAGYEATNNSSDIKLRGALPALSNYLALSLARAALASNEFPTKGLALFEETSALYHFIFEEKGIHNEITRHQSHDFISHCVHRGMILCETYEKFPADESAQINLQHAKEVLAEALESRKENKADGQRLGDVCVWLGRVYVALKRPEDAKKYFNDALPHYRKIFSEKAAQIRDVENRLADLTFIAIPMPYLVKNSTLNSRSGSSNNLQAAEQTNSAESSTQSGMEMNNT